MAMGYWGLLFISSILMHLFIVARGQDFPQSICIPERGTYTNNSTYQINLDILLTSFSNTIVDYGFYNSSAGEVNAIGLCRGDLSPDSCHGCMNTSSHELIQLCPNYREAIIYQEVCMLRYSDGSIFGIWEISPPEFARSVAMFPDVNKTNQVLQKLLAHLRDEAASGGPLRKYAVGEAVADFETIYALVQCTPDLTEQQCRDCLHNLKAMVANSDIEGRIGAYLMGPSCLFRYESFRFYQSPIEALSPSPTADFPSPPPSIGTSGNGNNNTRRVVIIVVIPTFVSMILIICIFIFLRMRKPREKVEEMDEIMSIDSSQLSFNSIKAATANFSDANKLGQGGFGIIYKGMLPNGQDIAVKRLSNNSEQGEPEFKDEVLLAVKLQHRNLLRFLGFCLEGIERLLIYEFFPNTSLDHYIFDPIRCSQLNWERRYKIIEGIARGLLYLHEYSRLRIGHRDLKASNILLDGEMNPKIAGFSMARLFSVNQTQEKTSRIVGTQGYMAPEYAMHGKFSVKSDVYSFGVLILEIISSQKNNCFRNGENVELLVNYAWNSWNEGTVSNLIHPILRSGSTSEIMRSIHIGLLCVQENEANRPTMSSVVLMLGSDSVHLPVPSRPPSNLMETDSPHNILWHVSSNEVSITEICPR